MHVVDIRFRGGTPADSQAMANPVKYVERTMSANDTEFDTIFSQSRRFSLAIPVNP